MAQGKKNGKSLLCSVDFFKSANPTWSLPVVLGVHCRECAGKEAGPGGRRGVQGQVRAPETLPGPFKAKTARIMHTQGDLPGLPGAFMALNKKNGFCTVKPKPRALSGAYGSKLTWEIGFWEVDCTFFKNTPCRGPVEPCAHWCTESVDEGFCGCCACDEAAPLAAGIP